MLSLAAVNSKEEARAFMAKAVERAAAVRQPSATAKLPSTNQRLQQQQQLAWVVEPKVDGLAIRLLYQDGKLVQAATRGDGDVRDACKKRINKNQALEIRC